MSASKEMVEVANILKEHGYSSVLPHGAEGYASGAKAQEVGSESTKNKRHGDLIRGYYEEIKRGDAVLIVNPPKNGVAGYIGGNSFLEFAFGHVLDRPVYLLYPYNDSLPYVSEMAAMDHTVLNGDLTRINL